MILTGLPFQNTDITIEKLMAGVVVVFVYFIPSIVSRDKKNNKYLIIFNLLVAWTILGWLVALVWSLNLKNSNRTQ